MPNFLRVPLRLILFAVSLFAARTAVAAPPIAEEYQVKAVFLFNFSQFIEWPEEAFAGPTAPFVIGVLGNDPFGRILDETVRGEKIKGRDVVVRRYANAKEIDGCHILYVPKSAGGALDPILALQRHRSVLTVGERDDFARRGGVIRFYMESNRVRFGINPEAARAANLSVSSKLLRHAEIEPSSFEPLRPPASMYALLGHLGRHLACF